MKQKNLLLVLLAAGCGLAAAVLTSKMSAAPQRAETVQVLVAAKDLPIGTQLKKEDLDTFMEVKEFTLDSVPAQYVSTKEDLADKRTTRTMRKGDSFNPQDVTKFASLSPPAGYNMMTIDCSLERGVAGFATPGSRVDILAAIPTKVKKGRSEPSGEKMSIIVPLLTDMMVLAVDSNAQLSSETQANPTMAMVSFAVTPENSLLLHAAKHAGSDLRLVLRNPDHPQDYGNRRLTEDELWSLFAQDPKLDASRDSEGNLPDTSGPEKVKLPVAKDDVAAGTTLTKDVIDDKFEMKEFTKPLPPQAIENLRDFTGKVLTSKLSGGQFVPKSFLSDKAESKPAPAVTDSGSSKPAPKLPPIDEEKPAKPEAPPVYHDYTVQTPNGVKKYRYQVLPNGKFKYLGEVAHDGDADKIPSDDESDAEPKKERKSEKRGEPV